MDELKKLLERFSPFSFIVDFFLKRARLVENTLKEKYSTVLRVGFLFASFVLLVGFYSLQ
jgi:protein TonB